MRRELRASRKANCLTESVVREITPSAGFMAAAANQVKPTSRMK